MCSNAELQMDYMQIPCADSLLFVSVIFFLLLLLLFLVIGYLRLPFVSVNRLTRHAETLLENLTHRTGLNYKQNMFHQNIHVNSVI